MPSWSSLLDAYKFLKFQIKLHLHRNTLSNFCYTFRPCCCQNWRQFTSTLALPWALPYCIFAYWWVMTRTSLKASKAQDYDSIFIISQDTYPILVWYILTGWCLNGSLIINTFLFYKARSKMRWIRYLLWAQS